MTRTVYFNGAFLPEDEARIGTDDAGWLHGAGLFETMRAEHGRVFRLESHLERLLRSAAALLMPIDRRALPDMEIFSALLRHNELDCARVRLTLSAGPMRGEGTEVQPTVLISVSPLEGYPEEDRRRGVGAAICEYRLSPSDPLAGHKTTCYLPRILGLRGARMKRCTEALWFTTANRLAEGCISNVFLVRGGTLKTPPLETPVLPGITRQVVLELAGRRNIPTEETPLTIDDLLDADEVFLTNTIMQILPVVRVERHDIGEGKVGSITRQLQEDYIECVRSECAPA